MRGAFFRHLLGSNSRRSGPGSDNRLEKNWNRLEKISVRDLSIQPFKSMFKLIFRRLPAFVTVPPYADSRGGPLAGLAYFASASDACDVYKLKIKK